VKKYRLLMWVLGSETLLTALYLSLIPGDPKNSVLFGLSLVRLVNIGVFLILAIGLGVIGVWPDRFTRILTWLAGRSNSLIRWQKTIWSICLLLLGTWLIPVYNFEDFRLIWERLLPSVVLMIGFLVSFLVLLLVEGQGHGYFRRPDHLRGGEILRLWQVLSAVSIVIFLLCRATGYGIIPPLDRYWNTAGVPVMFEQILYLVFGLLLISGLKTFFFPNRSSKLPLWVVFILLWAIAFLVWEAQPIAKSYFVYQPAAPNFEYYPLSDAQRFDLGGRSLLSGQSIFFGISEEKPFLMAFMALLNVLARPEYTAMVRMQVLILSLVVPFLFLIGRRLYSDVFGLGLAAIGIIYEINTFHASVEINSAHVKLFLSEPLTYLGVVIITYTLLRWLENPTKTAWGILTLVLVGTFTYVRTNVLLLYAGVFVIIFLGANLKFKEGLRLFLKTNLGFAGVLLPWMIYAKIKFGYYPIVNKILNIFKSRILEVWNPPPPFLAELTKPALFIGGGVLLDQTSFWSVVHLQIAHFMNNLIKSLLIFPTTLRLTSLETVLEKPYWDEFITWDGSVPPLFYINLAIIVLGVVALVKAKGTAGLVPLVIGLFYNLGSSLATTSGGRYLKPSIWVFILYYLVGVYFLLDRVLDGFNFPSLAFPMIKTSTGNQSLESNQGRWAWATVGAFLLISFLIPAVDAAIPETYTALSERKTLRMLTGEPIQSLGLDFRSTAALVRGKTIQVYYGDGLYPRQTIRQDVFDHFSFSIVGPYPALAARYFGAWENIQNFPNNSTVIALGCQIEFEEEQFTDLILIYLPEQEVFYSVGTEWKAHCPAAP
jgi:hypothetical protein